MYLLHPHTITILINNYYKTFSIEPLKNIFSMEFNKQMDEWPEEEDLPNNFTNNDDDNSTNGNNTIIINRKDLSIINSRISKLKSAKQNSKY